MKTAIKLLLIYLGFQLAGAFAAMIPVSIYSLIEYGNVDNISTMALAPAMFLAFIFMTIYLWKSGYISTDKRTWSPVSGTYLILATIICLASIVIIEYVQWLMPWLPNIMEHSFDVLQSGWLGILSISIFGPIVEELMFRGAITRVLLKKYNPATAITLSALVFGIFHINPVQIVTATLIGLLLAWIYYKTASLIPCILIHVVNNSLSVFFSLRYPEMKVTWELFTGTGYIELIVAIIIFAGAFFLMRQTNVAYPWKENVQENDII